ncbi:MAG: hypothetical protein JWP18_1187, partial [Solirubrobacterales bacterium]|nr:hypothetical protein [Solirubrobacterales bacterium]
ITCLVSVKTGIECASPDGHGLRVSVHYRRAY